MAEMMNEVKQLTNKMVDNRAKKIRDLKAQIAELESQEKALEDEIKQYMEAMNLDEIDTLNNVVKYTPSERSSFKASKLKNKYPDIYKEFAGVSCYKRFSIQEVKK